jgi:hypothetical protein
MLSVIVDAQGAEDRLAGLFAQLTPAAVQGLAREVLVAGAGRSFVYCQSMGAELGDDQAQAIARARSDWLLVMPAAIRFREGWEERLKDHLAAGPRPATLVGNTRKRWFERYPFAVLVSRAAAASVRPAMDALRRQQGADRVRLD